MAETAQRKLNPFGPELLHTVTILTSANSTEEMESERKEKSNETMAKKMMVKAENLIEADQWKDMFETWSTERMSESINEEMELELWKKNEMMGILKVKMGEETD